MLNQIWNYFTYNPYDRQGRLKLLLNRSYDKSAFSTLTTSSEIIELVLNAICESFDIKQSQKYCLRPSDNLGEVYRAITKFRMVDDMEFERLHKEIGKLVGGYEKNKFNWDVDFSVEELIMFVAKNTPSNDPVH